jgi:hypothetical protein
MSETTQPGTEIDRQLWERFRNDIKERKGVVRGNLRHELETAIREYLRADTSPSEERIEKRLARIEEAVGAAPTDGGTHTLPEREDTHTRDESYPTDRPAPNCATEKKVRYLAGCVIDREGVDEEAPPEIPRVRLIEIVKDEYGFRSDTAKRYVERLIDHFDYIDHPVADDVLATPERRDTIIQQRRERLADETDAAEVSNT